MTNQVLDCIKNRYTARKYDGVAVPREDLELIANAGIQSPSSMNRQRWLINVIENSEILAEIEKESFARLKSDPNKEHFVKSIESRGGELFYSAKNAIIVFYDSEYAGSEKDLASCALDTGIAIENMALAASSLGYGNCICGLLGEVFEGDKADEFYEKLGVDKKYKFAISLLVGKSVAEPTPHEVKPEKIHWT